MDGRRVVRKLRKAMLCLRTFPRRWQEHLSSDLCLFANTELDICIGVHVDDMLAVGPNEMTKNLLQELAKDMAMRWGLVTDKLARHRKATRLEFRVTTRQSCAKTLAVVNFRDPTHSVSTNLMTMTLSWTNLDNDVLDSCLVGYSGWDRLDIKNAVCQLSTYRRHSHHS